MISLAYGAYIATSHLEGPRYQTARNSFGVTPLSDPESPISPEYLQRIDGGNTNATSDDRG